MRKLVLIFLALTVFTLTSSNAAIYKGQRVFVKQCIKCHDAGQNFVAKYKMRKWKKLMKKKGKPLSQLHLKNPKAKKSHKYFKSKKYFKKTKHLKQFLIEYAKDSGNVPACN
ncbi:cytochrome C [Sulfurimonas aquatica]|uniref:Cytochrome C n=1 Tax=Sulfurimonas aquatica TaxID=2672570 RepID=A0A975B0U8_9BACT|nr:cytochrome C [Sulfurimonas aquatica]QSZ42070.1 cytochrome C [Sulfurimonas aquatica]